MKQNVLDWFCGTMTDATSAIVLTHNIDFLFLQSIVWPRLRKCGHPKLTVFADAICAQGSYRQHGQLLTGIGRDYRVVPVEMGAGRRFHPKAILLAGPSKAALAVGSGNLTHGGWSANQEIWTTYESGDDGLPAISAFRNYLDTVLAFVHQEESISEEIGDVFVHGTGSWTAELPDPAGLLGAPDDLPLLDRIVDLVGDGVHRVTAYAPYYDPKGEALGELARRIAVPVKALLQRNHVGLSAPAAATLPGNVELTGVDSDRSRFIHAKLFAFHRSENTFLVAGSANLSRAALMADKTWGNAELVAVQEVSQEKAEDLLADLTFLDEVPALLEEPPTDGWTLPDQHLRILAARFIDGVLEVALKSDEPIEKLTVEIDDGPKQRCGYTGVNGVARIHLNRCPKSVRLNCTLESGLQVSSAPAWVDDEASLGRSVTVRRIVAKLQEASETGALSSEGWFEIVQLLHQHLQHPTQQFSYATTRRNDSMATTARSYRVEDVFSEDFGRPPTDSGAGVSGAMRQTDFLGVLAHYFSPEMIGEPAKTDEESQPEESAEGTESQEISAATAKEESERRLYREGSVNGAQKGVRFCRKFVAVLEKIVVTMGGDGFVADRTPERLSADIAATALLLRKGLGDRVISEDDFASITSRLWSILFFGSRGEIGTIERHLEGLGSLSEDPRAAYETAMASPRLSAALILWCFPDWGQGSTAAIKFRFAAMDLAAKLPWLASGGTVEEVVGELRRLSRSMPAAVKYGALVDAWKRWVRVGMAFDEFRKAAEVRTAMNLAESCSDRPVKRGELLWQAGEFWVAEEDCRRDQKNSVSVRRLAGVDRTKFCPSYLAPVGSLLQDSKLLKLHEGARRSLLDVIAEVRKQQERGRDWWQEPR